MGPLKPDTCCSSALLTVNKRRKLEAIILYLTKQRERKAPGTAGGGCKKGTKAIFNFYSAQLPKWESVTMHKHTEEYYFLVELLQCHTLKLLLRAGRYRQMTGTLYPN